MTVSDTSKATFVEPNSVFHVEETARTNDSPGSIATLARTSVYTPNPTSDQQVNHRRKIALRIHKKEHDHGQVNEISEQDGDGDLQQMLRLKVPAQDDELDQDQQKAERNRELSQCKRKIQAEHIRDR